MLIKVIIVLLLTTSIAFAQYLGGYSGIYNVMGGSGGGGGGSCSNAIIAETSDCIISEVGDFLIPE